MIVSTTVLDPTIVVVLPGPVMVVVRVVPGTVLVPSGRVIVVPGSVIIVVIVVGIVITDSDPGTVLVVTTVLPGIVVAGRVTVVPGRVTMELSVMVTIVDDGGWHELIVTVVGSVSVIVVTDPDMVIVGPLMVVEVVEVSVTVDVVGSSVHENDVVVEVAVVTEPGTVCVTVDVTVLPG